MAIIQSGSGTTPLNVDLNSNAAHITSYGIDGTLSTNIGKQTYCAASAAFSPPATPTDCFTITGGVGKTTRILRVGISTTQTTAGINSWFLVKRSTPDSGGTSTIINAVPCDSNNGSAVSTVLSYTGNPSTGTSLGNVWAGDLTSPAPATASASNPAFIIDFLDSYGQPLVLRGTAQVIAWNFAGASLPSGLSVIAFVQWTEE
jgi:hypothetical protein